MSRFGIQPSPGLADHGPGSGFRPERADTGGPYGWDVSCLGRTPEKHGFRQNGNPKDGIRRQTRRTPFGGNLPASGKNGPFGRNVPTEWGTVRTISETVNLKTNCKYGQI